MKETAGVMFRGEFRPRGSSRWRTFTERPSSGAAWDELLVAPIIPKGADLRVLTIRGADVVPGVFLFAGVDERPAATRRPS